MPPLAKTLLSTSWLRYAAKAGFDIGAAALVVFLAFAIRLGGDVAAYQSVILKGMGVSAIVSAIVFTYFGMYRGLWRYASLPDLVNIVKAVSVAQLVFIAVMFQTVRLADFPRSVVFIQWLLLVMVLGGARLGYRMMLTELHRPKTADSTEALKRLLLVGTDATIEAFVRALTNSPAWNYRIVGLIAGQDSSLVGRSIHGIRILGSPTQLEQVVQKLEAAGARPDTVVFSSSVFESHDSYFTEFARKAEALGLTLTKLPRMDEFQRQIAAGDISPKPLTIEDILGRPQHKLDTATVRELVTGRRVLITGAGGSIGSELARQVASFKPAHLTLLDNSEFNLYSIEQDVTRQYPLQPYRAVLADVRSATRIGEIMAQQQPEVVFHAAALKHVPMVERDPAEGVLTNVIGTRHVADAAQANGARAVVLISTDKAVNPTNVMGAAKRLAEYYCQALDLEGAQAANAIPCHFMTVRFGNVLGSSGSVVPLFRQQIAAGGPVTVTHPDMRRYFMSIPEAVGLVLQASSHGLQLQEARGKIFVLDMGEPVRILDIAQRMIRMSRAPGAPEIEIVFSGLRPGEKLYEELFNSNEIADKTSVPGVLAAAPCPIELGVLRRVLANLENAALAGDAQGVRNILQAVVPGYKPDTLAAEPTALSSLPGRSDQAS
jgi:O-antigen biosynthesis protein WbqV